MIARIDKDRWMLCASVVGGGKYLVLICVKRTK